MLHLEVVVATLVSLREGKLTRVGDSFIFNSITPESSGGYLFTEQWGIGFPWGGMLLVRLSTERSMYISANVIETPIRHRVGVHPCVRPLQSAQSTNQR